MDAEQLGSLQPRLRGWIESFRPCIKRLKTFDHFECYLLGLATLSGQRHHPRVNGVGVQGCTRASE